MGFRHLCRSVGNHEQRDGIILANGRPFPCAIYADDGKVYLFSNLHGHPMGSGNYKLPREIYASYSNLYSREIVFQGKNEFISLNIHFILLPKDFSKLLDDFISSNKKLFSNIISKYYGNYRMSSELLYFYTIASDKPNLVAWGVNNILKHSVEPSIIVNILKWNEKYGKGYKLSKGSISSYNGIRDILMLEDETIKARRMKQANDVINTFNTAQKKMLKGIEMTKDITNILSRFSRLSTSKRINFIQKMSSVEDVNEILHQLSLISNVHFKWNKDSLIEYIKNNDLLDCEIVHNNDNIVLIKVNTYDTVKYLAKTTNWCISKNKSYWNNYINNHRKGSVQQYVIFDFNKKEDDELSIVGFTIQKNRGITHAHSFRNNSLMQGSYASKFITNWVSNSNNIYDILKSLMIDTSFYMNCESSEYAWNMSSVVSHIGKCIGNDYNILMDTDTKLVIETTNGNIVHLTDTESFYDYNFSKFIVFFDFEKDSGDVSRMLFALINSNSHEENCEELFNYIGRRHNETFNTTLNRFGLPYDTICRIDDKFTHFMNDLHDLNIDGVITALKDGEVMSYFSQQKRNMKNELMAQIRHSLINYHTFDFIDAIYANDMTICGIVGANSLGNSVRNLVEITCQYFRTSHISAIPTETEIDMFNKKRLDDNKLISIGLYLSLIKIIENETNEEFFNVFTRCLDFIYSSSKSLACDVIHRIIDKISFDKQVNESVYNLGKVVTMLKDKKLATEILSRPLSKDVNEYLTIQFNTIGVKGCESVAACLV